MFEIIVIALVAISLSSALRQQEKLRTEVFNVLRDLEQRVADDFLTSAAAYELTPEVKDLRECQTATSKVINDHRMQLKAVTHILENQQDFNKGRAIKMDYLFERLKTVEECIRISTKNIKKETKKCTQEKKTKTTKRTPKKTVKKTRSS